MKLASFRAAGRSGYGVVAAEGIIDIGARIGTRAPTLRAAIAADAMDEIARLRDAAAGPDFDWSEILLDIPIVLPGKIICIGRNYRDHVLEAAAELPKQPSVFIRTLDSFAPPGAPLSHPGISDQFDYEGELALVIGRGGRHIARADALRHIAGYTCLNDGSVRDFQFGHSLTVGKNFFRSGSIGPWMTTADDIGDPSAIALATRLNGSEVQHSTTASLIFDIPFLIEYLSAAMTLAPGDIIATGTPEGVGFARKPPLWMKPGDVVEVEISGIGVLRNTVAQESVLF